VSADDRRRGGDSFRRIADASSIGLAFPIAIAIGYFWGRWLDKLLGTTPWLTIVFAVMGVVGGFLNAFRTALRIGREEDEASRRSGKGS
jgi:F0F1-type ATP synthase assembly protein I